MERKTNKQIFDSLRKIYPPTDNVFLVRSETIKEMNTNCYVVLNKKQIKKQMPYILIQTFDFEKGKFRTSLNLVILSSEKNKSIIERFMSFFNKYPKFYSIAGGKVLVDSEINIEKPIKIIVLGRNEPFKRSFGNYDSNLIVREILKKNGFDAKIEFDLLLKKNKGNFFNRWREIQDLECRDKEAFVDFLYSAYILNKNMYLYKNDELHAISTKNKQIEEEIKDKMYELIDYETSAKKMKKKSRVF